MIARPFRFFVFVRLLLGVVALAVPVARAALTLPPAPTAHFNDYANYIPVDRARALDGRLAQFERDTSNQIVVAIYPRLPDGAALEDYTVRAAESWGVGQKKKDNGAVLFVFVADRALRIEVGYGLEGALTDAVSHSIIENELKPNLRAGRPADALDAAVNAMMAATRGEYRGTGSTVTEVRSSGTSSGDLRTLLIIVFVIALIVVAQIRRGYVYFNPSRRRRFDDFWDNDSGSGGSWGGGSSGGGGGFSGGGGSFGGGGASGKW